MIQPIQNKFPARQRKQSRRISHQDEHHYGQNVEDGIAKQRPPAQRDGLEREDTHSTSKLSGPEKKPLKISICFYFEWVSILSSFRSEGEGGPPFSFRSEHSVCTCPEKMPQMPMMTRMLKTADPTIVPTPTSPFVINTPEKNTEQERVSHKSSAKMNSMWQSVENDGLYLPSIHKSA